jgi:hypothetical protein
VRIALIVITDFARSWITRFDDRDWSEATIPEPRDAGAGEPRSPAS